MYSRVLQLSTAVASQIMLAACSTYSPAAPGISPNEMRVLVAEYYWQPDRKPFTYTPEQLDRLLRRSADPSLDGEYAEGQTASVVWALVFVGDPARAQDLPRGARDLERYLDVVHLAQGDVVRLDLLGILEAADLKGERRLKDGAPK